MKGFSTPMGRPLAIAVVAYAAVVICLLLAVDVLADRAWPATVLAFGPRWPAALPLFPLALLVVVFTTGRMARRLIVLVAVTGLVLVFGFMDYRLGLGRVAATPVLRIMTHNLGGSRVTGDALDRFMIAERIDIAALQECGFYNNDMAHLDWHFHYGGNLCLVSRYPFTLPDVHDPDNLWRNGDDPDRYEIKTPLGRLQLLNVHLKTIRNGLAALASQRWRGLPHFARNREESARESRAARERTRHGPDRIVIAGDFNLPVESAIYRAHWGDLLNAFSNCGRGFGHTKFTRLYGIRIDHVLASDHWGCADARVLSSPYGGDHAPLVVDLFIRN